MIQYMLVYEFYQQKQSSYYLRLPRPRLDGAGGVSSVLSLPRRRLPFFVFSSGVGLPFLRSCRSILSFHSSSFSELPGARL